MERDVDLNEPAANLIDGCPVAHPALPGQFDHHLPLDESSVWRTYETLRNLGPVHHTEAHGGFWVIDSYAETKEAFRDWERFTTREGVHIPSVSSHDQRRLPHEFDPPEHAPFRDIIYRPVAPEKVRDVQPFIEQVVRSLLEEFFRAGGGDFVEAVAAPLPLKVLTKVVGFSDETVAGLRGAMALALDRVSDVPIDQVYAEIRDLSYAELADHREQRPDDYITWLLDAEVVGRKLTDLEMARILGSLAAAGHETTIAAAGSMIYVLGSDVPMQERLRADSSQAAAFVEELLRLRPPAHSIGRTTTCDVEIGGTTIPAGERVLLLAASGNRDEKRFSDADKFDPVRGGRGHLSFGWGIHQCAGAALARAELRTLLEVLCEYPVFRTEGAELGVLVAGAHYGPDSVRVRFDRPGA